MKSFWIILSWQLSIHRNQIIAHPFTSYQFKDCSANLIIENQKKSVTWKSSKFITVVESEIGRYIANILLQKNSQSVNNWTLDYNQLADSPAQKPDVANPQKQNT